jgi:hypothetical protein
VILYYCDICSMRIGKPEGQIVGRSGRLTFTITRALDGTWNGGQVCRPCVLKAITEALVGS